MSIGKTFNQEPEEVMMIKQLKEEVKQQQVKVVKHYVDENTTSLVVVT